MVSFATAATGPASNDAKVSAGTKRRHNGYGNGLDRDQSSSVPTPRIHSASVQWEGTRVEA